MLKIFVLLLLVNKKYHFLANLEIILFRPQEPGSIFLEGGDIDNSLKTLFDALQMPSQAQEIPKNDSPKDDEDPFYCLLEDDKLISSITVKTHQLLKDYDRATSVELLIVVETKQVINSWVSY